jgi:hypothetical protein
VNYQTFPAYLVLVGAVACTSAKRVSSAPPPTLSVVTIPRQWGDTGTTSKLHIVVRDARKPIDPVAGAEIRLTSNTGLRVVTDARGYAEQDSLPAGEYDLLTKRLGYVPLRTRITIVKGCDAWAEIYLTVDPCDIGTCPPAVPARVTLSTCAPAV